MPVVSVRPPVRADVGIVKLRFVRSHNARAGGPRCRGRQRRCPVLRWMRALTCRAGDRRMIPPPNGGGPGAAAGPDLPSG